MLEVSFIPVREALRNLEGEGLVVTRPGRSAMVAPLDLDDLHAIYRLRRQLEPDMARRACRLITDADLDRLESDAAQFGDESLSMDAIYDNHIAFHLALLAPATSSWDIRTSRHCGARPNATSASGSAPSTPTRRSITGAPTPTTRCWKGSAAVTPSAHRPPCWSTSRATRRSPSRDSAAEGPSSPSAQRRPEASAAQLLVRVRSGESTRQTRVGLSTATNRCRISPSPSIRVRSS